MSALTSVTTKPKKQSFHATNVVKTFSFKISNLYLFSIRKWNELVSGFRSKIDLKKYRRNYFTQTYEQCFSSVDAINCMINVLKSHPNFETKHIEKFVEIFILKKERTLFSSRHHAIRLLEKFYESKVFTDVIKTERKKTFVTENGIYQ